MLDFKEMLKAGIHFGHRTSRWNPSMRPYIWGSRNKIHLIDVAKTAFLLERAGKYLTEQSGKGKSFLWIGTKKPAQQMIKKIAQSLKMPYVINRWIGGSLSNFDQIKKAITKLLYLKESLEKTTRHYKKKELSMMQKEVDRLEKNIGGILDLQYPPAAIIVVDAKKERSAIKEAVGLGIPVICMVDTNTNPEGINFVIPSNDDSIRSITFIMEYLASCIKKGQKLFAETKKEEKTKKSEAKPTTKKAIKTNNESIKKTDKTATKKASLKSEVKKTSTKSVKTEKKINSKSSEKKTTSSSNKKISTKK